MAKLAYLIDQVAEFRESIGWVSLRAISGINIPRLKKFFAGEDSLSDISDSEFTRFANEWETRAAVTGFTDAVTALRGKLIEQEEQARPKPKAKTVATSLTDIAEAARRTGVKKVVPSSEDEAETPSATARDATITTRPALSEELEVAIRHYGGQELLDARSRIIDEIYNAGLTIGTFSSAFGIAPQALGRTLGLSSDLSDSNKDRLRTKTVDGISGATMALEFELLATKRADFQDRAAPIKNIVRAYERFLDADAAEDNLRSAKEEERAARLGRTTGGQGAGR